MNRSNSTAIRGRCARLATGGRAPSEHHARHGAGGLLLALLVTWPFALQGQARIEAIVPESARVEIDQLGSMESVSAEVGGLLEIGDMITARSPDVQVTLACPPDSPNRHILTGPFRVMVSEPDSTTCAIDITAGRDDVLTEEPTELNAGGLAMQNTGTQFRVDVRRGPDGVERDVVVYDGSVQVRGLGTAALVTAQTALTLSPRVAQAQTRVIRPQEYRSSAVAYAAYDMAVARLAGGPGTPSNVTALRALHTAVLTSPSDTFARVDLAKTQIDMRANSQAIYNLKRVDVIDEQKMQRFQIDPSVLSSGLAARTQVMVPGRMITTIPAARRVPDLTVQARGPARVAAGGDVGRALRLTVVNEGSAPAVGTDDGGGEAGYVVDLVLSTDESVPTGFARFGAEFREDVLLRGGRISNTPTIPAGESVSLSAGSALIPANTPPGRYCLGIRVDPGGRIDESNEDNNTACVTIQVVRPGASVDDGGGAPVARRPLP